jgi:integrase
MVEVQESPDDRIPERPVFPGGIREALRNGMASTCKAAEIANYSPHDLRHKLQLG